MPRLFRRILLFSSLLFFTALSLSLRADLVLPPVPDQFVYDPTGLLSIPVRQQLQQKLEQFERESSNQVLVAIVPDLQGETIEDFGIRLAERWKPGQKGRDNGVILLVARQERKARVEVGYGLEGALPDAVTKSILENEVLRGFKAGNFDGGISAGVTAILQATRGEYSAKSNQITLLPVLIFFLFFFLILYLIWKNAHLGYSTLGRQGTSSGASWSSWSSGSSGGSSGGSWGGGGGFSSGGGSFGGGGASGSW